MQNQWIREVDAMEFSKEISQIMQEMLERFNQNPEQDPIQFAINIIKEVKEVDDQEAKKILSEIIKGIKTYRELASDPEKLKQAKEQLGQENIQEIEQEAESLQKIIINPEVEEDGKS